MISATPPLRTQPSFWLTAVCLLVSGTVAGLFVSLLVPTLRFSESDLGSTLLYITLASALIGGLVLRAVLPRLAGAAISYPWAVAALGLGGAAGNAFLWVVQRRVRVLDRPAVRSRSDRVEPRRLLLRRRRRLP